MKTVSLIVLSLISGGCTIAHPSRVVASTAGVSHSIEAASQSAGAARTSIRTASEAVRFLSATATPAQKPAVVKIRQALGQADTHVATVSERLGESTARTTALQGRIDTLAEDLGTAQETASQAKVGARYWKGAALKLGIVSAALLLWLLRKPVAALFGIPMI